MGTRGGTLSRTRHTTLTQSATQVARTLAAAGLRPHPGYIDARSCRSGLRITVWAEPTRVRITVSGDGHQEILIYGALGKDQVTGPLERTFGASRVTTRDPHGIWKAEAAAASA